MLVLAILSWGAVIALLAIFVRLNRLAGLGYGGAFRPKPRSTPRLGAARRHLSMGETLPQRH